MADASVLNILNQFTENVAWSIFLTSAAVHAVLLITSPLQAVHKWHKRQSSDSDTPVPYFFGCIGSALWLRYAIFIGDIKLMLLQMYAVVMQIFIILALIFYRSKKRKLVRAFLASLIFMLTLFVYMSGLSFEDGKRFSGRCASGAQIAGSFVCPYLIYKAVTTRVIDFIPIAPVAFTWVMEMHAIGYSIGIDDFYMLLANTIFFCMDGMLLSMFFIFPSEKPSGKINVM